MRIRSIVLLMLLAALAAALVAGAASACPNCKDALADEESSTEKSAALAYSWSVLAMLALLGIVAFALIRVLTIAARESTVLPEDDPPSGGAKATAPPPGAELPDPAARKIGARSRHPVSH